MSLIPDLVLNKYSDLTPEYLKKIGVCGLLLDIDNTLEPYENPTPTEGVVAWLGAMADAGIKCAFVSNNGRCRVEQFNESLGLPAFYKARKPFRGRLVRALDLMGVPRESAAIMGDQIFTDVLAGRLTGIRAFLVPPIKDKTDPFTRLKRFFERGILKRYDRKKCE